LFQDVYEWAGKLRTVPSSKRSSLGVISWFAEPDAITSLWHELEQKCSVFAEGENLNLAQKVDALAQRMECCQCRQRQAWAFV
jgi:cell filamentation protein